MKHSFCAGWLALLAGPLPLPAVDTWILPHVLDTRGSLEITPHDRMSLDSTIFLGVLFDAVTNSLELARVNVAASPPTATFVPVAGGSIFALGGIDRAAGFVGFSWIDAARNLQFARCAPPCNSVSNFIVDATTDWIDSSSVASGDDFYVAGLHDATNAIHTFFSDDGGFSWDPLNVFTPPDLYVNFNGGKRVRLAVDPSSTDPTGIRNCRLYETRPAPGTVTQVRLNCMNGASALFDILLDTDIPNPSDIFDPFIETSLALRPNGSGGFRVFAVYTKRQTQQVRAVTVNSTGAVLGSPANLGAVPAGSPFYSVRQVEVSPTLPKDRIFFHSGPGSRAIDIEFDPTAPPPMARLGPTFEPGPISILQWSQTGEPADAFLFAFANIPNGPSNLGAGGFGVASRRVGLFDDSFETQNLTRWSSSSP